MTEPRATDPWFDESVKVISGGGESIASELAELAEDHPEFAPTPEEIEAADGTPQEPIVSEPVVENVPEVITLQDGSKITKEKLADGTFQATLDPNDGSGKEVFHGRTETELINNVLVGKLNSTKKIRELNRTLKVSEATPAQTAAPASTQPKVFTADEIFALKTKLASDPALAMEEWFQQRTGMSVDELVKLAKEGQQAKSELAAENEARAFVAAHEDYYATDGNRDLLFGWLNKHQKTLTKENLAAAFEDLSEAGLLEMKPEDAPVVSVPAPVPAPVAAPVVPAPSNERIVREERRPRAALGIRTAETTTPAVRVAEGAPTDEGLRKLSPAELEKLFQETLRMAATSPR